MAIFEEDEVDVREYLVLLDVHDNVVAYVNPANKKIPLEMLKKAFDAKGIKCEIRQSLIAPVEIIF